MSRVVGVRLGAELQSKLEALCARTGQHKSDVLRQVLTVVSVEQLRQASQESKGTREEQEEGAVVSNIDSDGARSGYLNWMRSGRRTTPWGQYNKRDPLRRQNQRGPEMARHHPRLAPIATLSHRRSMYGKFKPTQISLRTPTPIFACRPSEPSHLFTNGGCEPGQSRWLLVLGMVSR